MICPQVTAENSLGNSLFSPCSEDGIMSEVDRAEIRNVSWEIARAYADRIGHISAIFTSSIREITIADEKAYNFQEQKAVRDLTVSKAAFLIRVSPSLKAVLYFSARSLYPERLLECQPVSVEKLTKLFKPGETASIIALTYLYRAIRKLCDKQEFHVLEERMKTHMEIGTHVGATIANVDTWYGMLLGGLQYLALALLAVDNLKKFQVYRRKIEKEGQLFDLDQEQQLWSCNHLYIAAYLAQMMGFSFDVSRCLASLAENGTDTFPTIEEEGEERSEAEELALRDKFLCWHEALTWTTALHSTGEPPVQPEGEMSSLAVPPDIVADLRSRTKKIREEGSRFDWICKRTEDLPPDVMEQLNVSLELLASLETDLKRPGADA